MAWPTTEVSVENLNQGSDIAADARADIHDMALKVNAMITGRGQPNGVAALDAGGNILQTQSAASILSSLLTVDGAGSGLDADLLDGVQGSGYVLTDASRDLVWDNATEVSGQEYEAQGALTSTVAAWSTYKHTTTGTPAAGFGGALDFDLENSVGDLEPAARLVAVWDNATDGSELAEVELWVRNGGASAVKRWGIRGTGAQEMPETTVSGNPPTNSWWMYFATDGLHIREDNGTDIILAAGSGATDHGALTGLSDDDHTQYLLVDGTRDLTGALNLGQNFINEQELAAKPANPSSSNWRLYFKASGLFQLDDAGVETAVGGGGVSDHGGLTGLLDNDHTQYLLRQPAANVVINESGGDFNLRVESTGMVNALFLDAGNDVWGINTGTPSTNSRLHIEAGAGFRALRLVGTDTEAINISVTTGKGVFVVQTADANSVHAQRNVSSTALNAALLVEDIGIAGGLGIDVKYIDGGVGMLVRKASGGEVFRIDTGTFGEVLINSAQLATMDFRHSGDTISHLLFSDAGNEVVNVNGQLTTARFNATGGTLDAIYGVTATVGKYGVVAEGQGSAEGLHVISVSANAIRAESSAARVALFTRNASLSSAMVTVDQVHLTNTGTVLQVLNAGTGHSIEVQEAGTRLWSVVDGGFVEDKELGGDPSNPAGTYWALYFKSDGLYYKEDDGTVVGPLGVGGASTALSALTNATGTNTLTNGANTQTWNWAPGATGNAGLIIGETSVSTVDANLVEIKNKAGGKTRTMPLYIETYIRDGTLYSVIDVWARNDSGFGINNLIRLSYDPGDASVDEKFKVACNGGTTAYHGVWVNSGSSGDAGPGVINFGGTPTGGGTNWAAVAIFGSAGASEMRFTATERVRVNAPTLQITPDSSAPSSPTEGDLWADDGANVLKYYNGSSFITLGSGGASSWLLLTDSPGAYVSSAIPHTNVGSSALLLDANFTYAGDKLTLAGTSPSLLLTPVSSIPTTVAGELYVSEGGVDLTYNTGAQLLNLVGWNYDSVNNTVFPADAANTKVSIGPELELPQDANYLLVKTDSLTVDGSLFVVEQRLDRAVPITGLNEGANILSHIISTMDQNLTGPVKGAVISALHEGTATATLLVGLQMSVARVSTGNATNVKGITIEMTDVSATGTLTTCTALEIPALAGSGTPTTAYAIRQIGAVEFNSLAGRTKIGDTGTPATSAVLELSSTTHAFLLPRMTTTQRNALAAAQNGMMIYNVTTNVVESYENGSWVNT